MTVPPLLLSLSFVIAGCSVCLDRPDPAPERVEETRLAYAQEALDLLLQREVRLLRTSYRIRVGAADLCGDEIAPILGLSVASSGDSRIRSGCSTCSITPRRREPA